MRIIFSCLLCVFFVNCQTNVNSNYKDEGTDTSNPGLRKPILSLLDSLEYSYVKNLANSDDTSLLKFYKKTSIDFKQDSLRYYTAVSSFFKADSTIIDQLLLFYKDSSKCKWIYSPNPYSSNVKKWEFNFSNENGAKVLIYTYIMSACGGDKKIPNNPGSIEYIVDRIDMRSFLEWFRNNRSLNHYQLCQKFKKELF
ncbi:hypothetical protein [Chitinophaga sp. GbtcB8]|uniref:hypothetical protein n=1 Tax=Chitinophaga sp. GbtcB8 TaxID=2824753 RepID=UPI001C308A73|nr:hypothetical protein [Chitinophaga sp. GbtcB8]